MFQSSMRPAIENKVSKGKGVTWDNNSRKQSGVRGVFNCPKRARSDAFHFPTPPTLSFACFPKRGSKNGGAAGASF